MTYVNITALTYPAGAEAEIEERFAHRLRLVDRSPGFQGFELLRPVSGETRYFVVTRWDSRDSFEKWSTERSHRHADGTDGHEEDRKRGMHVELLGFEVVQADPH